MKQYQPFYLAYEMDSLAIGNDWKRDYDYMKCTYPETAKKIMPYVEEECDRMEYSGSMMFDEYPDQLQLRMMCRRIYNKVMEKEDNAQEWMYDLIYVLSWHEIMKKRAEYRHYRKKFY